MEWSPRAAPVRDLMRGGVNVHFRPRAYSLWNRAWRKATSAPRDHAIFEIDKLLARTAPSLVVFSDGGPFPWVTLLELCVARRVPFVTIGNGNSEERWLEDDWAARHRAALAHALQCYFVSKANLRLAEKQLGSHLSNADVVWNPFNVAYDAAPPWPVRKGNDELQIACVGRLHPPSKGQDLLFEALATPAWIARSWHLNLYGEGRMRDVLGKLAEHLGLSSRVTFAGQRSVEEIWAANHVLAMPSRYEGLPLAVVEAMLCGRVVLATNVAGHAEVMKDNVTGFLAEAPTVSSVAGALERLWVNRARLEEMGAAGAKRIRELVPPNPVEVFTEKIQHFLSMPRPLQKAVNSP
jgi:glycosyltransferase involved in cell wall biosynthesis